MLKKFKSKNERTGLIYPVYQKVSHLVNTKARKLADWLNQKCIGVGKRGIALLLMLFSLGWCAASVYVVLQSFEHKETPVSIRAITVPRQIHDPPGAGEDAEMAMALQRIKAFKQHMDSLQVHDPADWQKIVQQRPGLMDSISIIFKNIQ